MSNEINVLAVIEEATIRANEAVESTPFTEVQEMSNGSEAWQAVSLRVKGMRKVQNQLKKIEDVRYDSYHGYLVSAHYSNFYKEELWTETFASVCNQNGIPASRTERLL